MAPAPRARRARASVSTGDGSRERGTGSGRASRDAEVDAYVARVCAHGLARRCADAMTHAQRWADASEALEALEIDVAWRVESAFDAAKGDARPRGRARGREIDAGCARGVHTGGAVERARDSRVAWNERIALAAAEVETECKNSEAATEGDDVEDVDAGRERDDEVVEDVDTYHVDASSDVASPVRARELSSEEAAVRFRRRLRARVEAGTPTRGVSSNIWAC